MTRSKTRGTQGRRAALTKKAPKEGIQLNRVPKQTDHNEWADYVELRCVADKDGVVSRSDLADEIDDRQDQRAADVEYVDGREEDAPDPAPPTPKDLKREVWTGEVFVHLRYRQAEFGDRYPFEVAANGTLVRKPLTADHRLYLFMLLASNTRVLPGTSAAFTRAFEVVSGLALKQYLPPGAAVHVFSRGSSRYKGNLYAKLSALAIDLREELQCKASDFKKNDSADRGLDVVGWLPFSDPAGDFIKVFGQCACTYDDWEDKQLSVSAERWRAIMQLKRSPDPVGFIPICFRQTDGQWYAPLRVHSILLDRVRLMWLLRSKTKEELEKVLPVTEINAASSDSSRQAVL